MAHDPRAVRALVARGKHRDQLFVIFGLLAMMVGLLTLALLLAGLLDDGIGRLDWQFFSNFPSRRAERAGILARWSAPAW